MRTVRYIVAATLLLLCGCAANIGTPRPIVPLKPGEQPPPVTLTMWTWHTGPEADQVRLVLDRLHRDHPWLTVKMVKGKDDFAVLQGIYSGDPPDLAVLAGPDNVAKFCASRAMPDLGAVARSDGIELSKIIPPQVLETASYRGVTCALPWLTDAYGLFYNKTLFRAAGLDHPPRSMDELERMSKKLTTYNPDGSLKVAGFVPLTSFYHSNHLNQGPTFGASWYLPDGRSALGTDPRWVEGLTWQKRFIDSIGYDKLTAFARRIGDDTEYTPNNAFATGKVAMILDGEYRVGYLERWHSVDYATAPFPTLDPARYGSAQIGGTMISMPATARHPAASWFALKYLALETGPMNQIADGLQNVPTTYGSLATAGYGKQAPNAPFVAMLKNPHSVWKQPTPAGRIDLDLLADFAGRYESGGVPDPRDGLRQLAATIDAHTAVR